MTITFNNTIKGIPETLKKQEIKPLNSGFIIPIVWGCIIPYVIDNSVVYPNVVLEAIKYVSTTTDYSFTPRTDELHYILFKNGDGCYTTALGQGENQLIQLIKPAVEVVLSKYCDMYAIVHELGHILGLNHTMKRQDRDDFISINTDNIVSDQISQFEKDDILTIGDFDFSSSMMYGRWQFNKNPNISVITPKKPITAKIGSRKGYSIDDIKNINNKAHSKGCSAKSLQPPCKDTDIEFNDGDIVNTYISPNGYYYKINDLLYEGYNIYNNERLIIIFNKDLNRWEIKTAKYLYAYSTNADLFGTNGWYVSVIGIDELQLIKEAKMTKRNCVWPNLAGYSKDVPFHFLEWFFTNMVTIIGIIIGIVIILFIAIAIKVYKKDIEKISKNTLRVIRSFSVSNPVVKIAELRRKTV
jgi:hypothetical protein